MAVARHSRAKGQHFRLALPQDDSDYFDCGQYSGLNVKNSVSQIHPNELRESLSASS